MRKILRFIAYSLIVFTLSSCAKEVLHPEQMIEGEFAFDDGTGFCDEYISFNKGILTTYVSQDRVVLKDGYLWNASFVEKSADKYSIVNDKLYVNSKDRGSISYLDMLVWDTKIYTRVKGFKNEEESIYYYENGKKLGKAIAVLGNWDGNSSTPNTVLYWAPVNCGYEEKGTVNSDSDHRLGKLYQWGAGDSSLPYYYNGTKVVAREMYYDTATPSPWYNKDVIDGTTSDKWNNNQGPCPDGWRLPTSQEFEVLCAGKTGSYGWIDKGTYAGQSNTYAGAEFFGANTDKTVGKGVFFPAAGYRYRDDGGAFSRGSLGDYWSSTPYSKSDYAYKLSFDSSYLNPHHYGYRAYAFSVRCVSGEGDPQGKVITPAIVATIAVRDVTNNSAICEGKVTSEGEAKVTERGFCYSTYPMPTVMDTKVKAATYGLGSFTCDLTDLAEKTTYYVRAYAVNAYGTYYGNVMTFTTLEDVRPNYIEGGKNLGKGISILGDWNADGIQTTLYWAPVNCGYEEKGTANTDSDHRLGKLYQWGAGDSSLPYYYNGTKVVAREMYYDTATPSPWYNKDVIDGTTSDKWNNNQGPCPDGWRLPTSQEFEVLCAGKNGDYGWVSAGTYAGQSNTYSGAEFFGANADKTVGKGVFFPAAGGYRNYGDGSAICRGSEGFYWSSTPYPNYSNDAYYLFFDSSCLFPQTSYYRSFAHSVRCVSGEGDPQGKVITPAIVATIAVRDVTNNSAICEGKVTSEGEAKVTERGVCYSTSSIPSLADSKVKSTTSGMGTFTCKLTGLNANTTYYVRAYAVNVYGTYYGDIRSFTTPASASTNHDYIENGVNHGAGIAVLGDWNNDGTQTTLYWAPVNCGYEEKGTVNTYSDHRLGKLYQWGAGDASLPYKYNGSPVVAREMYYDTVTPSPWYDDNTIDGTTSDKWNNNQGPCPEGWRLPTSLEFKVLCAGKNGSYGWDDKGTYAGQSNTYAGAEFFGANSDKTVGKGVFFPAAGYRGSNGGSAYDRGSYGRYWSSSPYPFSSNDAFTLNFYSSFLLPQYFHYRASAFSVRCLSE